MADKMTKHTHHMSYSPDSVTEAIGSLPGKVDKAVHQLVMVHDHDNGDRPHHHVTEDAADKNTEDKPENKSEDKPKRSVLWFGEENLT